MSIVTILGAGAMGSALATPLADAGHDVRLWGTHLDDHLIAAARAGLPHPRTAVPVAEGVTTYLHGELTQAMYETNVVIIAVSSVGVADIARLVAPYLQDVEAIALTSKGFAPDSTGQIQLLPQTVATQVQAYSSAPIVAIGGPCKANEVASRQPTATIWAVSDGAEHWTQWGSTAVYRIQAAVDRDGVELCAALKNVYAIALGVADGLTEVGENPFHDLKSAIFAQGLAELRALLTAEGADPWTALGLAGAGDLEVTGLSGRNKVYGVRLGKGESATEALAAMTALEQTVEGVPAARLAWKFVSQRHPQLIEAGSLPLLGAIIEVVHGGAAIDVIQEAALPTRSTVTVG